MVAPYEELASKLPGLCERLGFKDYRIVRLPTHHGGWEGLGTKGRQCLYRPVLGTWVLARWWHAMLGGGAERKRTTACGRLSMARRLSVTSRKRDRASG